MVAIDQKEAGPWFLVLIALTLRNILSKDLQSSFLSSLDQRVKSVEKNPEKFDLAPDQLPKLRDMMVFLRARMHSSELALADPPDGPPH